MAQMNIIQAVNSALDTILEKDSNVCIFGEDVVLGKPNPECYNLGIESLGLSPNECLIFEDTLIGVCAGEKAGASVINVSGWCT